MSDAIFRPSPDILVKQFFFAIELFCYFAYYNLSSLCSSFCRRSCSPSRSNMSSHCVRYCAIGFSGNEVCKALIPPRSAPPYVTKEREKKRGSHLYYSAPNLNSRDHFIQNSPLDILKLKVANIYWVIVFTEIILLGLLTQAKLLIHIKQLYDQPCSLFVLVYFYFYKKWKVHPRLENFITKNGN